MDLAQGGLVFLLVATIFILGTNKGIPANEVRALTFFTLIPAIFVLVLVNRSFSPALATLFQRPNANLVFILSGVLTILGHTLFWPTARDLFAFGPLHVHDLAVVLVSGIVTLLLADLLKLIWQR